MCAMPLIGLTLDSEPPGGYSKLPWYALRENYFAAVRRAGGLPVALPHEPEDAAAYLDRIDGLIIPGGGFDVDPALFGVTTRHASVTTKDRRTAFELAITREAVARDMPVLGICGGEQLLNVALGGTLIQHIPDEVEGALAHEQANPRTETGHSVRVVAGTLLHGIVGADEIEVNSAHHQAVRDLAPVWWSPRSPPTGSSRASRIRAAASASASSGTRSSRSAPATTASSPPSPPPRPEPCPHRPARPRQRPSPASASPSVWRAPAFARGARPNA